jgi:hypothetical protein
LDHSAGPDRNQRECAQAGAALRMFAVPADREGEQICDEERCEVRHDVEGIGPEQLCHARIPTL